MYCTARTLRERRARGGRGGRGDKSQGLRARRGRRGPRDATYPGEEVGMRVRGREALVRHAVCCAWGREWWWRREEGRGGGREEGEGARRGSPLSLLDRPTQPPSTRLLLLTQATANPLPGSLLALLPLCPLSAPATASSPKLVRGLFCVETAAPFSPLHDAAPGARASARAPSVRALAPPHAEPDRRQRLSLSPSGSAAEVPVPQTGGSPRVEFRRQGVSRSGPPRTRRFLSLARLWERDLPRRACCGRVPRARLHWRGTCLSLYSRSAPGPHPLRSRSSPEGPSAAVSIPHACIAVQPSHT